MTNPLYVSSLDAWRPYSRVFRRAKQSDPRLARIQLQPTEAPAGCQRLLAFGDHPDFAAEYALVRKSPEELDRSGLAVVLLRWYCGVQKDSRVFTHEQWLSRVLGVAVKEVVE